MKFDDLEDEPASRMDNLDHSSSKLHDHHELIREVGSPPIIPRRKESHSVGATKARKTKRLSKSRGFPFLLMQIRAVVTKIMLSKFRTPFSTCMEIFTPVLMMLILVSAYTLSDVLYKEAETYDTISIDIPGPWVDLAGELIRLRNDQLNSSLFTDRRLSDEMLTSSKGHEFLRGTPSASAVLEPPVKSEYLHNVLTRDLHWMEDTSSAQGWSLWSLPLKHIRSRHKSQLRPKKGPVGPRHEKGRRRQLQDFDTQDDDSAESDNFEGLSGGDLYDLVDRAYSQIRKLLKSPMFVPRFDEYVGLSNTLGNLIDVNALPRLFTDSSYGRQWGNLLTLGTIHLSPSNSNVTEVFLRYLNDTYPLLFEQGLVKIQTHESEQVALEYIDSSHDTEQTWALIDLSRFPEHRADGVEEDIRYKIRMNYTTLVSFPRNVSWKRTCQRSHCSTCSFFV